MQAMSETSSQELRGWGLVKQARGKGKNGSPLASASVLSPTAGEEEVKGGAACHGEEHGSGGGTPASENPEEPFALHPPKRVEAGPIPDPGEPEFAAPDENRDDTSQIEDAQLARCDTPHSIAKEVECCEGTSRLICHLLGMLCPEELGIEP